MKDLLLAIDVGTQSTRALVFDACGRLLDKARAVHDPPYVSPNPGWAEMDPDFFWDRVGVACRGVWENGKVKPQSIAAVAMTFQRATVIHLGADLRPLRPAILWLDQRRCGTPPTIPLVWQVLLTLAGARGVVERLQAEAECNWVAEHEPDVFRKTAHLLLLSGFITLRMTGMVADSVACTVGYLPFDYKRQAWATPSDWRWKALAVRPETLPTLIRPGELIGEVTKEASEHTGIPAGVPVISGASDKACEVLGSGCTKPHQGCIGFGTTATLNVDSPRYVEPVRLVPPYPSAQSGHYNIEYQVFRGFWMVTWFKEQFAQIEREKAERQGVSAEVLLEELAREVPAGSLGLILQPYWTPGLKHPGPEGKGAIVGFGAAHRKQHMYRAILEGLAYEMRAGRERIEARTNVRIRDLVVCGGGSRSDLVMQIVADVFGMPARRTSCEEASGLGAAILAAKGVGFYKDVSSAVAGMTAKGRVFEPISANVEVYEALYRKVYSQLYMRLQPLYRVIREITGYPPYP